MFKKSFISILLSILIIICSLAFFNTVVHASGTTSRGWYQISKIWYYANSNGINVQNSWEKDSSQKWFYLGSSGAMVTNTWARDSSKQWFYLGSSGEMVTNTWAKDSSKRWFYLGADGAMVTNTWEIDSSKLWFYLGSDGGMLVSTGFITLNEAEDTLTVGSTYNLTAYINQKTAAATSVKWSSSNCAIATVDNLGTVSALAKGTAIISVISADGSSKSNCTVTVNPKSLLTFAIDMGHNANHDSGAVGIKSEDTLNEEVGTRVIAKLTALGYNVVNCAPTNATSTTDSLAQRCYIANAANADYYLAIHFNSFDGTASGSEAYVGSSKMLPQAQQVLKNLAALGYINRGVLDNSRGLYVLSNTNMPAMLIECAFVDSTSDMARYNPDDISTAIVNGLLYYN